MTSMSQLDELPAYAQRNKCHDGATAVTLCSISHQQYSLYAALYGLPCGQVVARLTHHLHVVAYSRRRGHRAPTMSMSRTRASSQSRGRRRNGRMATYRRRWEGWTGQQILWKALGRGEVCHSRCRSRCSPFIICDFFFHFHQESSRPRHLTFSCSSFLWVRSASSYGTPEKTSRREITT